MKDYSEIMETLPTLHRKRDDALRDQDWQTAYDLHAQIIGVDEQVEAWLDDKLTEVKL